MRLLDTSVLVASLDPEEPTHARCNELLEEGGNLLYVHAIAESFSILTGGSQGRRVDADTALRLLEESILPFVQPIALGAKEVLAALRQAKARGVRGGAVYDYLHLAAARKADAVALLTLNRRDFEALARPGDPEIRVP